MATSTFSLFFPPLPSSKGQWPVAEETAYSYDDHSTVTTLSPSSPASSASSGYLVDCTLSLGTPSTRQPELDRTKHGAPPQAYPSVSAGAEPCYYHQQQGRGGAAGHDQLLDRRCANCGTASTPLWRNGPRGPKVHKHLPSPMLTLSVRSSSSCNCVWIDLRCHVCALSVAVAVQRVRHPVQEGGAPRGGDQCRRRVRLRRAAGARVGPSRRAVRGGGASLRRRRRRAVPGVAAERRPAGPGVLGVARQAARSVPVQLASSTSD
uniref:GATA-type domain-containing protein n=1 Tax=Aegilops tauschii subsp. strangulata TaxID=200361 RepID=A0A453A073_AEGTS